MSFAELGLSKGALEAVNRLRYDEPTPVQEQAIPLVLQGRDLIAAASTGTGKTAAFLLPLLSTLPLAERKHGKARGRAPRILVVTPTRELAQQIATTCMKIARETGHFVTTVYGGMSYTPQIRELKGGTDVLIVTPGRLKDLMGRDVVDLGSVTTLVLDEADRMLDMGFLPDVTTIVEATPAERQTLLFSATIDESIRKNLGSLLREPAIVQIAQRGETAKTVEQFIMPIRQKEKPELLRATLDELGHERVIVFVRTRNRTEEVAEELCSAGYRAESIHSDKSQARRRRALEGFRRGKTDILVATDVLARGIDVTGVDYVINYDLPDMSEDYVHRIGRTGRAGKDGFAVSFVTPDTRRLLADIQKLIGKELDMLELENYQLDASLLKKGGKRGAAANRGGKGNPEKRTEENRKSSRPATAGVKRVTASAVRNSRKGANDAERSDSRKGERRAERASEKRAGSAHERGDARGGQRSGAQLSPRNAKTGTKNSKHSNTQHAVAAKKRQKKRPKNITDVRSYGEHRHRRGKGRFEG